MKQLIPFYFKTLSVLAPELAGKQAFSLFQHTRKNTIRSKEKKFYNLSRHFTVASKKEQIDCYELGNRQGRLVLLVHGWDSNAGSMAAIAFELAEKGYHVVAFNLPAHGYSRLKKANLKICREYFLAVVSHLYTGESFSIVAHSFGSAVTTFSLADSPYKIDKLVFLTSPNQLRQVFDDFKTMIHLTDKAYQTTVKLAEKLLEQEIDKVSVEDMSDKIEYKQALFIHDKLDRIIPFSNSVAIANKWQNTSLLPLERIGHYRMLWNEYVVNSTVKFLGST